MTSGGTFYGHPYTNGGGFFDENELSAGGKNSGTIFYKKERPKREGGEGLNGR